MKSELSVEIFSDLMFSAPLYVLRSCSSARSHTRRKTFNILVQRYNAAISSTRSTSKDRKKKNSTQTHISERLGFCLLLMNRSQLSSYKFWLYLTVSDILHILSLSCMAHIKYTFLEYTHTHIDAIVRFLHWMCFLFSSLIHSFSFLSSLFLVWQTFSC